MPNSPGAAVSLSEEGCCGKPAGTSHRDLDPVPGSKLREGSPFLFGSRGPGQSAVCPLHKPIYDGSCIGGRVFAGETIGGKQDCFQLNAKGLPEMNALALAVVFIAMVLTPAVVAVRGE